MSAAAGGVAGGPGRRGASRARPKIGTLTIGQSPRDDVVPEFLNALGMDVDIVQKGALDGLSMGKIAALAPSGEDFALVTRLKDGAEVRLGEAFAAQRLQSAVKEFEGESVDLVVLFCTGDFPDLRSRIPILRPNRLLGHIVQALFPPDMAGEGSANGKNAAKRLCVVAPSKDQIPFLVKKWEKTGLVVAADSVSPYSAPLEEVERCADRVAAQGCDVVVLDCIGFGAAIRSVFRKKTGVPVILPRTLAGRVAAEMLE